MANRRRYVADPSLSAQPAPDPYASPLPQQPTQQAFAAPADQQNVYGQVKKERIWADDLASPPPPFTPQEHATVAANVPLGPVHHIPPPPHAAGPSLRGRVGIDPSQIPDPVLVAEMDQALYDQDNFESANARGIIPCGTTDYRGVDQGNSLPRYIRSTLLQIPNTNSLLDTSQLPLGLVLNPFAAPRYDEAPIPYVSSFLEEAKQSGEAENDPTAGGPPRCAKCRGYVNPWCKWVEGGTKWMCNLCNTGNPAGTYASHLDSYGTRLDIQDRPELSSGTVDFAVPRGYWATNPSSLLDASGLSNVSGDLLHSLNEAVSQAAEASGAKEALGVPSIGTGASTPSGNKTPSKQKKNQEIENIRHPQPIARLFAIDVSWNSSKGGVLRQACQAIKEAIYGPAKEEKIVRNGDDDEQGEDEWTIPQGRVGIMTFDSAVQFHNLSPDLEKAQMMVVSDLEDMFVPLHRGFLVDPIQSRTQIESLLDALPQMYTEPTSGDVAIGALVKGVLAGLAGCGGQLSLFLCSLPSKGPGALKPREDPLVFGTDKEKTLYSPADGFWRNSAEQLAEAGIGCNLWLFPERYIDVASLSILASVTGGSIFFHPRFDPVRDRSALYEEVQRAIVKEVAYNVTVRLRCSNGLRVSNYSGNFHQRSLTDLEFGTLDSSQAFGAILKHDSKLDDRQTIYVQAAVLYTSASGERRVRVLNLSLAVTNHIGGLFRFADFDTVVTILFKEAVTQALSRGLPDIRRALTERCVAILLAYRKNCAAGSPSGQLTLPEGFKLLPLLTLCMTKSKALKGGNVSSDVRALYLRGIRSMTLTATVHFLYPRMFSVHDLPERVGYAGEDGKLQLPRYMRCSHTWMVADGAYILTNGETAFLWLGAAVSPQILNDLYGVENLDEIDTRITSLPRLPTYLSTQVRNILGHHARLINHELPVIVARQNMDGTEMEFANMLVEDSNNDALEHGQYLMSVHQTMTEALHGGGKGSGWFS